MNFDSTGNYFSSGKNVEWQLNGIFFWHSILILKSSVGKYCPSNFKCDILRQFARINARSAKVVSLTPAVDIDVIW